MDAMDGSDITMSSTVFQDEQATVPAAGDVGGRCPDELLARYGGILAGGKLKWTEYHNLSRRLGRAGRGWCS